MAPHTELCALIRNRTVKCGDGPFPPILKATAEGLSDRCIKDRSRPRNAVIVSFPDTAYSAPSECERHEESPRGYLNAASDRISQHGTEPSLCADVKPLPACFRMIRYSGPEDLESPYPSRLYTILPVRAHHNVVCLPLI